MTIDELYAKIQVDDALKEELLAASAAGTTTEWVASQGVDATEDELIAYIKSMSQADGAELSVEDLERVAGGGYETYGDGVRSVASYGTDKCAWD